MFVFFNVLLWQSSERKAKTREFLLVDIIQLNPLQLSKQCHEFRSRECISLMIDDHSKCQKTVINIVSMIDKALST